MGVVVLFFQKMDVVGRHQPNAELFRQLGKLGIDAFLFLDVFLHFDEESIRSENVQIGFGDFFRGLRVAPGEA